MFLNRPKSMQISLTCFLSFNDTFQSLQKEKFLNENKIRFLDGPLLELSGLMHLSSVCFLFSASYYLFTGWSCWGLHSNTRTRFLSSSLSFSPVCSSWIDQTHAVQFIVFPRLLTSPSHFLAKALENSSTHHHIPPFKSSPQQSSWI